MCEQAYIGARVFAIISQVNFSRAWVEELNVKVRDLKPRGQTQRMVAAAQGSC